jgi:hypothetical protein
MHAIMYHSDNLGWWNNELFYYWVCLASIS